MKRSLTLIAVIAVLVVASVLVFAACIPSNPDKAAEAYKKAGYEVSYDSNNVAGKFGDAIGSIFGKESHLEKSMYVYNDSYSGWIFWYDSTDVAKSEYESAKADASDDTYVKRDGKAVFVGDKEAYNKKKA